MGVVPASQTGADGFGVQRAIGESGLEVRFGEIGIHQFIFPEARFWITSVWPTI